MPGILEARKGKIKHLRVCEIADKWGSKNDVLDGEVVVVLDSSPKGEAYGFRLRPDDPNLSSRLGMLALLRDAFIHNLTLGLSFYKEEFRNTGNIIRIDFEK